MYKDSDNWVKTDFCGYDSKRYDYECDGVCLYCQECGSELDKAADRSGGIAKCPECEYIVYSY